MTPRPPWTWEALCISIVVAVFMCVAGAMVFFSLLILRAVSPQTLYVVVAICVCVSAGLLVYAWKERRGDFLYKKLTEKNPPPPPPTDIPICCRAGVEEISRTCISGSWICPTCNRFHCFVDGLPGKIDL